MADADRIFRVKSTFATNGTPQDSATLKPKHGNVKELLGLSSSDSSQHISSSSLSQAAIIIDPSSPVYQKEVFKSSSSKEWKVVVASNSGSSSSGTQPVVTGSSVHKKNPISSYEEEGVGKWAQKKEKRGERKDDE